MEKEEIITTILEHGLSVLYHEINEVNQRDLKRGELIYVCKDSGEVETLAEIVDPKYFDQLREALSNNSRILRFAVLRSNIELSLLEHLSPKEFQIYAYLRATMLKYNILPDTRTRHLAIATKSSTKTVTSALRTLRNCNVIFAKEDRRGKRVDRINPAAAWNGPLNHGLKAPPLKWHQELSLEL